MIHLLFSAFYAANFSMAPDGALLISSARERALAWGVVFCLLAAGASALFLFRAARRWAPAILIASMLIPVLIIPSVRRESIHVSTDGITIHSGAWFSPSRTYIDLSDMDRIHQDAAEFRIGGRLVESNAIWHVSRTDGRNEKLLMNHFFTAHRMAVAQYLRDRGGRIGAP